MSMKFLSIAFPILPANCSAKLGGWSPSDPNTSVACHQEDQSYACAQMYIRSGAPDQRTTCANKIFRIFQHSTLMHLPKVGCIRGRGQKQSSSHWNRYKNVTPACCGQLQGSAASRFLSDAICTLIQKGMPGRLHGQTAPCK